MAEQWPRIWRKQVRWWTTVVGGVLVGGLLVWNAPGAVAAETAASDLTTLKEQIKREVLAELCQQLGDAAAEVNQAHERLKEEIKQEILQELRRDLLPPARRPAQEPKPLVPAPAVVPTTPAAPLAPALAVAPATPTAPAPAATNAPATLAVTLPVTPAPEHPQAAEQPPVHFGDAEGRVVQHGKPLANCKVRLMRLESSRFLLIRSVKYGIEFETVTDEKGHYLFHRIPVGDYKLKWLTPGATSWVRRIRDKPDVTVIEDQTATLKEVEAGIAPVAEGRGS